MKRIAILGPIPRDHIVTHQGDLIQKWGCVTHPVIALSTMAGNSMEIIPVSHLRQVDLDNVREVFRGYAGINLKHLTCKNDQGDIISLKFVDMNNRLERQTGFMDPILPDDIKGILDCDVFVFIPISDYEISLETLQYIKANSKGLIVFDAHGPTTACLYTGERQRKFWVDRDQWLPYIDVLKMNLEEANASWFKKEYESRDFIESPEVDREDLRAFADHCLGIGVKCVYITVDSRGCLVYFKDRGKVREEMVPAVKVNHVIDTTGCGDSFAGGVGFGLLQNPKDYIAAARYGNALGALRTQGKTFAVFKSLEETDKIIQEAYFEFQQGCSPPAETNLNLISACIFDLDGVIVDTARYHYLAWKKLARELGYELTPTDNERLKGVSRMTSLEIVLQLGGVTASEHEKVLMANKKNTWFNDYLERMVPEEIYPGVRQLLRDLRSKGLKVGLASSSKNAKTVIQVLHIQNEFDVIVDGTMITQSKPHPEIFLLAAQKLNVKPEECLVFEDAEAGVEAALAAGMKCVGVGNAQQLDAANEVVAKTADFKIAELANL